MELDADLAINMFVGDADFDEVTKITDEAAEFLSEQDEILFLDGLTELSDAAAESFSKHQCGLGLDGLSKLSDAAAESLSKHQGGLVLGLTELSDAAAESLSKSKGEINGQSPPEWVAAISKKGTAS